MTSFDSEPIGNFEGSDGKLTALQTSSNVEGNGVNSRQVEVHHAYYKVNRAKTAEARKKAENELAAILERRSADSKFGEIASIAMKGDAAKAEEMLEGDVAVMEKVVCHKAVLQASVTHCGSFDDYSMRYSRLFANLCSNDVDEQSIVLAIEAACGQAIVV